MRVFSSSLLALALVVPTVSTVHAQSEPKPGDSKTAEAKPPAAPRQVVSVKSVEPKEVEAGDVITVAGTGLDQASAIVFGTFSPEIVEKSPTRLTFRAPKDTQDREGYEAMPLVMVPGRPIVSSGKMVYVSRKLRAGAPRVSQRVADHKVDAIVQEEIRISAKSPKTVPFDLGAGKGVKITLEGPSNVEVEASLVPDISLVGASTAKRGTYGGRLSWTAYRQELLETATGNEASFPLTFELRTDSTKEVTVKTTVLRLSQQSIKDGKSSKKAEASPR